MIDLTTTDLTTLTAVELRKTGATAGIKGASKGKKAELLPALEAIKAQQIDEAAAVAAIQAAAAQPTKTTVVKAKRSTRCTDCGFRRMSKTVIGPELCDLCLDYAELENLHQDQGADHAEVVPTETCPICHPELDKRHARTGRSRAGMVIVAKGTEIHKSQTFKVAAEAAGWKVTVTGEVYDNETEATRYFADAYKGENAIQLAWDGRAYDYSASSALIKGKNRKVRNLKEALRLLVG